MASSSTTSAATALWPPDDTEESIVGVDRHQLDIISLRTGINEEAHREAQGGPLPWQAISQIMLLGCRRPDGSAYTVYPDVYVFPRPMDRMRGSYSLAADGAPALVIEVASESTVAADLDESRGKAWSYADAGVAEYLVLDPTGELVPGGGQGWRLVGGVYQPWAPDAAGHWQSARLPLAFGSEGGLAAAFGPAGRHLREGEVGEALRAQAAEGRLEGYAQGRREERLATLRRLVQWRFGEVPALEGRLATADDAELDRLLELVLTAAAPSSLLE